MDEELLLSDSHFDDKEDLAFDCFGNHGVLMVENEFLTTPASH
jgi:hypothetical protein